MSINTADFDVGVAGTWRDAGLDDRFTQYWTASEKVQNIVLHEDEAAPHQPFPYCTVTRRPRLQKPTRMTGKAFGSDIFLFALRELHFKIHAKEAGGKSAKQVAAEMAGEVMKVFGGHPTTSPTKELAMENGSLLMCQYQSDNPEREELYRWAWEITYVIWTE